MTKAELDEYRNAFNKEGGEEVADKSKDAEQNQETAEGDSDTPSVEIVIDPETAVDDAADEAGIPGKEDVMPAEETPVVAEEPVEQVASEDEMSPEDIQRQKSWEGRLRKREEELAAREAALSADKGEVQLAEGGESDGEGIEEIKQELSGDFGDRFVEMIVKIAADEARKLAGKAIESQIGPINETLNQAINDVSEAFRSMHFGAIAEAYEDFQEIIGSPEFQQFIESMPDEQKAVAGQILESGTAKQVVKLLADFKASIEASGNGNNVVSEEAEDPALDAAEGVRGSAPVSLPGRAPTSDDDEYRSAWNSM